MADYGVSDVEYFVVSGEDQDEFFSDVEEYIRDGWTCKGGVSVVVRAGGVLNYFQAMTKTTEMRASEYRRLHPNRNGGSRKRKTLRIRRN